MTSRPTLTAAIITLNEERNLPGLLERLAWVDEIVVVDGGSRDDTVEIARGAACCVARRHFADFSDQRNLALRLATGDWVLSIDADERPTPALIEEVQACIGTGRHAGFRVPIRSSIFGRRFRFSGTQGDLPVRLFRRDRAQWSGGVHEVLRVAGRIGRLRHGLEHRTTPDLTTFMQKMHRYTSLAARERVAVGHAPRPLDAWTRPAIEIFRRLVWKHGYLDGPEGWAFCLLSGLSEWTLARKHRAFWKMRNAECGMRSEPPQVRSTTRRIPVDSALRISHSALST
jgi:glycosyltransferase involved in cell wall biosynthesis